MEKASKHDMSERELEDIIQKTDHSSNKQLKSSKAMIKMFLLDKLEMDSRKAKKKKVVSMKSIKERETEL